MSNYIICFLKFRGKRHQILFGFLNDFEGGRSKGSGSEDITLRIREGGDFTRPGVVRGPGIVTGRRG